MSESPRDQVKSMLADMGMEDIQLPEGTLNYESAEDIPQQQTNFGTIERDAWKALPPGAKETYDDSIYLELDNGIQVKLNVSARPVCENCGKLPTEKFEERGLRECAECETQLCSCAAYCHTCDKPLCYDCRTGYSDEGLVLCPEHKEERYQERQFETQFQVWARKLEHKINALEKDIQFQKFKFDKEKQMARVESEKLVRLEQVRRKRDKDKLDYKKKELTESRKEMAAKLEHEIKRRKRRLERFKEEVNAEIQRREARVQEFEAKTEREDKREQRRLEEKEMELEDERERAEAAMDHRESMAEEERKMFEAETDREKKMREEERKQFEAQTDRREVQNEFEVSMREQDIEEMEKKLDARLDILEWVQDDKELEHDMRMDEAELAMTKREKMLEIAEGMRELKWDERNDFLDFAGRLQNEDFARVGPQEDEEEDDDDNVIVLDPSDDEDDDTYEFTSG